jgi:hypothetical protein
VGKHDNNANNLNVMENEKIICLKIYLNLEQGVKLLVMGNSKNEGQIPIGYQPRYMPTYWPIFKIFKQLVSIYNHGFQKI